MTDLKSYIEINRWYMTGQVKRGLYAEWEPVWVCG